MTKHAAVVLVVVGVATLVGCSIGDTYVDVKESKAKADAGAGDTKSSTSETTSLDNPLGGATCGTDDFTSPDVSKLTACGDGKGKGHCFDKSKTPMAAGFVACADASMVCVPDEVLKAGGKPLKSCKSIAGDGACFSAGLVPEIERQGGSVLTQDVCDADQKCVPCKDPLHGNADTPFCQPIGVHEKACAAAPSGSATTTTNAPTTESCCTTGGVSNGICIAETAIPESDRDSAPADSCKTGNRCVPKSLATGQPVRCSAGLLGKGVCLDQCFDDKMAMAGKVGFLQKDSCGATEICVPCLAMTGKNVPGCE